MTDTPPDWVLIEAAKRSGWDHDANWCRASYLSCFRHDGSGSAAARAFVALCDMIQKYEQPPVDRKVLCAREASTFWHGPDALDGSYDSSAEVCCSIRAIELWEEGFGRD